jgi:hypothetical protein
VAQVLLIVSNFVKQKTMSTIIKQFQQLCADMAITQDSPSEQVIREYFDRYAFSIKDAEREKAEWNRLFEILELLYSKEICEKQVRDKVKRDLEDYLFVVLVTRSDLSPTKRMKSEVTYQDFGPGFRFKYEVADLFVFYDDLSGEYIVLKNAFGRRERFKSNNFDVYEYYKQQRESFKNS